MAQPTDDQPRYRMWWLKDSDHVPPLLPGTGEVADPTDASDIYVSDFSSRGCRDSSSTCSGPRLVECEVHSRATRASTTCHGGPKALATWSDVIRATSSTSAADVDGNAHTTSVAALIMEKHPSLTQLQVETILKSTALPLPPAGSRSIFDFDHPGVITWDTDCDGTPCDAVGAGVLRADAALSAPVP